MHETQPVTLEQINFQNDGLITEIMSLEWTVSYPSYFTPTFSGKEYRLIPDKKIVALHTTFETDTSDLKIMIKKLGALQNALDEIKKSTNS